MIEKQRVVSGQIFHLDSIFEIPYIFHPHFLLVHPSCYSEKQTNFMFKKELQIALMVTCSFGILIEARTQDRTITTRREKSGADIKKLSVSRLMGSLCKLTLPKEEEKEKVELCKEAVVHISIISVQITQMTSK